MKARIFKSLISKPKNPATMKSFISPFLFFLFVSIVTITNGQPYVDEIDPQRSIYVDKFITINVISHNAGNDKVDPANSVLSVDEDHDGIFEKEQALLEYCMDHHITSLVLLDLHKILGKHLYAWNQNTNSNEDMEVHLCRFMDEARANCITEIIASGQSSGFFNSATTFSSQFTNPSPPYKFTPDQKNNPAFSASLLLAEDVSLQPGDDGYYFREFLKFYLRAAFFGTFGTCTERFNRLHMEYEFWQSGVDDLLAPIINNPSFTPTYNVVYQACNCTTNYSANQYYDNGSCTPCQLHTYPSSFFYPGGNQQGKFDLVFIPVVNTIRSIKKLVNSGVSPSDPNYVRCEAYLHSLNSIANWNALQIFIDGNPNAAAQSNTLLMTDDLKHLFDLTSPIGAGPANPHPDYDMLPNIERPLPAEFNPCIGGNLTIPAHSLTEDGFQVPNNPLLIPTPDWFQNNTDVHFILNGESIANNGYDDYLGAWFPGNSNRNIFEAERIYYNEWRDECVSHIPPFGLTDPTTNDVHRGAVLWYTQTQIIPTNRHAPLQYQIFREHTKIFTSDNPLCGSATSPANVVIHYIGPSESSAITPGNQVEIKFWVTNCNGVAIAGQPSVTSPVITKTYSATYYFNNNLPYAAPDINLLLSPVTGCNFLVGHMKLTYNQGCTYEYQENLYINSSPTIASMGNTTFCEGDFVILRANNGGVGATYAWTRNGQPIIGATGIEYSATLPGTYRCQITGSSSCTGLSNSIIVTVNPSPPVSIIASCDPNPNSLTYDLLICDNDLSGGPPYSQGPNGETYQWSTGDTENKIHLDPVTYNNYWINVTVTTPAGCKRTDWKRYSTSGILSLTATPTDASALCINDGSVNLSITCPGGGCSNPYRLIVTDGASFSDDQWRIGSPHTFNGLAPGNYTTILTGSFGICYTTSSFTIRPNSTTTINATITPSTPTCNTNTNGQLVISNITPAATNYIITVNGVSYPNVGSGITITNLPPGSYPVRIELPNPDCSYIVFPAAPNTTISPAHAVSVTTTTTPSACSGGNTGGASSDVLPAIGNYIYLWTPGNFTTANISNKPAGSYIVTVTDAWGCTATAYANISPRPAILITVANQINPCQGANNGSLELDVSGGNGSYNISPGTWNLNSSGYYERTGMSAGTYTITVTSGTGCSATQTFTLTPVSLTFNVTNATCAGHSSGSITAISVDGTAPFTYNWNPGGISPGSTLVNQPAGNYTCTVTDGNSCTASSTATITNGGLIVSAIPGSIACNGGTTDVTVSASGGSGNYTGTGGIPGVHAGQHTYSVQDNNGCSGSVTITILQPDVISVTALFTNIPCNGTSTTVTVLATGGTGVFTGTGAFPNVSAGNHIYTVTDNNSCIGSTSITITQNINIAFQNISSPCIGASSGSVTASASGGTAPYNYSWNTVPVQHNAQATGLVAGTYTVTATDGNGCTITSTVTVPVNPACCGGGILLDQAYFDSHPIINPGIYNLNSNITLIQSTVLDNCQITVATGVSISTGSFTLTLQNGSTISSCGNMWRGIIVNSGGNFTTLPSATSCKIYDAQYGVDVRDDGNINIDMCEFINDWIGVNLLDLNVSGSIQVNGYIKNSSFYTSGSLKPGNPSRTPYYPYSHSFAGIRAYKVALFNIGINDGVSINRFNDMNFGIYSTNSNLVVTDYSLRRIKRYDTPSWVDINALRNFGSAVYTTGNPAANYLTMTGRKSTTDPDFQECVYGVNSSNSNIDITGNRMENCDFGINVSKGNSLRINAVKNYIECNTFGISLIVIDRFSHAFLQFNEIYGGQRQTAVNGSASTTVGINIAGYNLNNTNTIVNQNTIHLYDYGLSGIKLNAIQSSIVNFNYVTLHNLVNNTMKGISLSGSQVNNISCNSVQGTYTSQINYSTGETAFDIYDSRSNDIKCNSATQTSNGIRFSGTCHGGITPTTLRSNDIGNHYNGLVYTASALVDPQINMGNWWYLNTYAGYAATNLNPSQANVTNEEYEVYANLSSGQNKPIPSEIFVQAGVSWFFDVPTDDANCGIIGSRRSDCNLYTEPYPGVCCSYAAYSKDEQIALDQINSSTFNEETKWKDKVALYEKLLKMPDYKDDHQVLSDFFQSMAGTTIQKVASINVSNDEITPNQEALLLTIKNNSISIYQKADTIRTCDSTLALDGLDETQKDNLIQLRTLMIDQIKQLSNYNNQAFAILENLLSNKADLLNSENNEIISSEVYEQNEKIINEIYLNGIVKDDPEYFFANSNNILEVAQQCPLAGGPAVHRARSLYMLIDPEMQYEDELTCLQSGWLLRTASKKILPIGVFPNPASSEVNITYNIEYEQMLQVIDNLGRICMQFLLNPKENRTTRNISMLSDGIYTLRISGVDNLENNFGRLTILR